LKLLIGAEVAPEDAPPVVLLASDRSAYGRLSTLLTLGRRGTQGEVPKGDCRLTFAHIAAHAEGLLACLLLPSVPGVSGGPGLGGYRETFGDRCYGLISRHFGSEDRSELGACRRIARQWGLPLVASNNVLYHVPRRRYLHDVLTAIRHRCTVAELGRRRRVNGEHFLKSPAAMQALFADEPAVVARTVEVADRCHFSLNELRYEYPQELSPPGSSPLEFLVRLTWAGARERYPAGVPEKVRALLTHELNLIEELQYEAYFLTVWDLVRFARERGILCQGRGSAANSAVCYCLGVTSVDPDQIDVLFERFVSRERNEAPDIDIDFEHERREEVIQYVYEKYGRDRAGMTAEVITYRPRSALRDIGKALGISRDRVDRLAKSVDHAGDEQTLAARFREAGLDPTRGTARQWLGLVREMLGFPRHLSQHVGGMVITHRPLHELVPLENAAMPGRTVVQWDKDDLDELGILKVDCLALGMLTAIRRCFDLIARQAGGPQWTLASIPPEDPAVYEMISRADTIGVFQIESRAQMSMLPRLRPRCFYDLVIEVAIVRPGPIQGQMVHPYLRRRRGAEPVEYPDERIRQVLHKTLGVPIFQEQAMKLAVVAAGFSPGEADQLRRAMGAWRRRGLIDQFRQKLLEGMQANGYASEFGERLFQQISGFGEYGFPESHAASFARLVYVSAWLKRYSPAAFAAALLNSQPMGFYAPAQLVRDARHHGVTVLPVDVNHSDWDCTLERVDAGSAGEAGMERGSTAGAVRLGLRMIAGLARRDAARVVKGRAGVPFRDLADLARRTSLGRTVLAQLARADAFRSLGLDRRKALWQSLAIDPRDQQPDNLFRNLASDEPAVPLPVMSEPSRVLADYRATGLSLEGHPLAFVRPQLNRLRVTPAARLRELPSGRRVQVAGIVLLRQRPGSAKGITFVTLEDETGMANLIIRPEVWERFRRVARSARALLAGGDLQSEENVIHVVVRRLRDLSVVLADLPLRARDFR
jgi:error-prone DNA polymerase